jgi:hypothetical protein
MNAGLTMMEAALGVLYNNEDLAEVRQAQDDRDHEDELGIKAARGQDEAIYWGPKNIIAQLTYLSDAEIDRLDGDQINTMAALLKTARTA